MEEVKNLIKYGQEDAARDRLEAAGLTPKEINNIVNNITDPKTDLSRARNKKFNQHSTDAEKARRDSVAQ